MATLKDVAEAAGVSTATVSHVINGTKRISQATREKVLDAIQQVHYSPNALAKSLRVGKTKTIGILVEDIRGMPIPEIVCGVQEKLDEWDYRLLLNDLHLFDIILDRYEEIGAYKKRINNAMQLLLSSNVDGIIYISMHDRPLDYIFDPVSKPVVFAFSYGGENDTYVTHDNQQGAMEMTRLLIRAGHSRIAVIGGPPYSYPTYQRMNGFQLAMQEAGLPVRAELMYYGNWKYESGYECTMRMMSQDERPTAVFAMNDVMAAGCMHALADLGMKVPEDTAVVGFDNQQIAEYLQPGLTTVALPTRQIGNQAAECLMALIKNPHRQPQKVLIPCTVIERKSV